MGTVIDAAVTALNGRLNGTYDGVAIFVFGTEGAIALDAAGARIAGPDDTADVTLRASIETFRDIFDGILSPMSAFMTGKLDITGDMSEAMRLGKVLA